MSIRPGTVAFYLFCVNIYVVLAFVLAHATLANAVLAIERWLVGCLSHTPVLCLNG